MKLITLLLTLSLASFGAISPGTVWEVGGGNAANGGGFDPTVGTGVDMSQYTNKNASGCTSCQSSTANLSVTNAVTNNTTTVTSTTANFTADLRNNTIYLAGSGTTTGHYQVVSVESNTSITVDRATGSTGGTGVTLNIGGKMATWADINSRAVAGNTVWTKSFTAGANQSLSAGATGLPIRFEGYTTTRGDGVPAVITYSGAFTLTPQSFNIIRNVEISCGGGTAATGVTITNQSVELQNVTISGNCTTRAINIGAAYFRGVNLYLTGHTSPASVVNIATSSGFPTTMIDVTIAGNATTAVTTGATSIVTWINPIFANNGVGNDCLQLNGAGAVITTVIGGTFYKCRDAILQNGADSFNGLVVRNSTFISNSGYGINAAVAGTNWTNAPAVSHDYNAFYNNTSGNLNRLPAGPHDVTSLGASPFTDGDNNDFSLNSTANGGALLRAAGFPGVRLAGGTGYRDIGAIQHQDAGTACPQRSYAHAR